MNRIINFFFSFDKLMKEKLVVTFFWLGLIVFGLDYFSTALSHIQLKPLALLIDIINFFGRFIFLIVSLRLISEVCVAAFRINDHLSPDGGISETADIDPIAEARKAAKAVSARAQAISKRKPPNQTKKPVTQPVAKTTTNPKKSQAHKAAPTKAASAKKTSEKKTSVKKSPAKKTPAKTTSSKTTSTVKKTAAPKKSAVSKKV